MAEGLSKNETRTLALGTGGLLVSLESRHRCRSLLDDDGFADAELGELSLV